MYFTGDPHKNNFEGIVGRKNRWGVALKENERREFGETASFFHSYKSYKSCVHVCAKSRQSCPTLCSPLGCSLPGSCVHGILQTRILEWIAIPSSRGSSQPRDQTHISYIPSIGRWVLYHQHHMGSPIS